MGTQSQCPKVQDSGVKGHREVLRAEGSHLMSQSFCKDCYQGVISAGSAGTQGGDERKDIVKMLKQGGKLSTETWNPRGCNSNGKSHGKSPLITSCSYKPSAVPGIMKYYKDKEGVTIADKDVHFYDDQPYNIAIFEGKGYNAHQVSCGETGGTTGGYEAGSDVKCGLMLDEFHHSPGLHYCCSGSQKSAPSGSSTVTTQCGTPCHFPFTYHGKSHNACTSTGEVAPWCATQSQYSSKNWGYCHGGNSDVAVNQTKSDVII